MTTEQSALDRLSEGDYANLNIEQGDIDRALCQNRGRCVLSVASNRQFNGLKNGGYGRLSGTPMTDARTLAVTHNGFRYTFLTSSPMVAYLRRFDEIGEKSGIDVARKSMKPRGFRMKLISKTEIPPTATRARKDQINAARNKRNAERRLQGEKIKTPRKRYVGV